MVTVALTVALVVVAAALVAVLWRIRVGDVVGLRRAREQLAQAEETLVRDQQSVVQEREQTREHRADLAGQRSDLAAREQRLREQVERADERDASVARERDELERTARSHEQQQRAELERLAQLSSADAKAELIAALDDEARHDAAVTARRIETEARAEAEDRARTIVADSIQRVASDQTAHSVVAVVHLPSDDLKGRVIGREGRNIRCFESVTGVNVVVDDTPETVVLSCFDPVRRETARVTMQALIDDGRIHPHRIEEAYERAHEEVQALCQRAADDAILDVGISHVHPELMMLIGQLKYRSSYGQNVLAHVIETSQIARTMAFELGVDPEIVTRGAFLHDIGKALTHEADGSHAMVGADLARRYGESEAVAHCIEAHHDEVAPTTIEAVLTQAADACSGGRPGARQESLESYATRLRNIEAIAQAKDGVAKVYAMQAGRELRVMVKPDVVDDVGAQIMAREVAKQIEEELTYPGNVRVTVIRESRASEVAR